MGSWHFLLQQFLLAGLERLAQVGNVQRNHFIS